VRGSAKESDNQWRRGSHHGAGDAHQRRAILMDEEDEEGCLPPGHQELGNLQVPPSPR